MFVRKPLLIPILAFLALSAVSPASLRGEEEPYLGLWGHDLGRGPTDELFLYRAALRYRAKAVLRDAAMLPETFRAVEDSLGMISSRLDDFSLLQDSLALGWLPPSVLPGPSRDYVTRNVSVQIDSGLVQERVVLRGTPVHPSAPVSIEEYLAELNRRTYRTLWAQEAARSIQIAETAQRDRPGLLPELALPVEMPGAIKSIVGAGKPNLKVTGSERISFSGTSRWQPNLQTNEIVREQSKFPQLDMKQELNLKLSGNIGDKVSVDVDQSSQAATPLANRIRINYSGYEDEIIQRVELGNTSLSLPGTQWVSYSGRHEGLFGINARGVLGDLEVAGILSKQEGKNETKSITKGAERQDKIIQDWQYRAGKFFFLVHPDSPEGPLDLDVGSVQVWIDDRNGRNNNTTGLTVPGIATLSGDPELPEPDSLRATGQFDPLVQNEDFIIQTNVYTGYPILILADHQVLDGKMRKAMGVIYRTKSGRRVGGYTGANADTLVLKLIRPSHDMGGTSALDLTQGVFAQTRWLELRNVYDLGRNLSQEGLEVRIRRKGTVAGASDPDQIGGVTFLTMTGLDLFTNVAESDALAPPPDGLIDPGFLEEEGSGYLMFRALQPFAPTTEDVERRFVYERGDTLNGNLAVPGIYLRNDWSAGEEPDLVSRYYFVVTALAVSDRITLGFNLLHGSETVTSGGRTLIRDRDYTIDYDTGEIQILNTADVGDADQIRVSYSYLPFGGGGQKTLIGSGLRFRPQDAKFGVSTTWVYESKGAPGIEGRRPRLGQEPTRTVVGEFATSYKTDSWALSSLVDALPGVSTRQKSNFSFEGGMGLSFPNPNTRNKLYLDDFEGAKDEFMVSMNRLGWKPSGIPRSLDGTSNPGIRNRGECYWYSPRTAVREGDLQPTEDEYGGLAETEKDNNRQILELHFFPNGETPQMKRDSWFSLVQPLSSTGTDLSRAQFLDVWINDYIPFDAWQQREGRIHLEIGSLSEDAVWQRIDPGTLNSDSFSPPDGKLNTEDQVTRDGQLDDPGGGQGEDRGVDFLLDSQEEGSGEDPAHDNWLFSEGNEDADRDKPAGVYGVETEGGDGGRTRRYMHINGTQGNGKLDTEDLDGDGEFDTSESYFHFAFDLADTSLVAFESSDTSDAPLPWDPDYRDYTRGWRRIRIPLAESEFERYGTPRWDQVYHLRFWLEGFSKETYLQLGGIDITGNRWLKGRIDCSRDYPSVSCEPGEGEDLSPGVLNNKDNSPEEYNPPFKPRKRQDVEEREQSLTLEMRSFAVGHQGTVFRTFPREQDLSSLYRTLEFYVKKRIDIGPNPDLDFFIRFARDAATDDDNYYEYRVPVPDDWGLMKLDLEELSRLQLADTCLVDTCLVWKELPGDTRIVRKGNPNLTTVRRMTLGVINRGPAAVVSGSVWIDELRLTGVKRDTGMASRATVGLQLADLGAFNLSFQQTDADFLRIGSDRGSGNTKTNYNLGARMNLDRFFTGTGLNLPIDYSASRGRDVPKFRPSSDLVLEKATDRDISESKQDNFSFSADRVNSENRLLRYTIDAVSVSGRFSETENNSPLSRMAVSNRSGNIQYGLPLGGGPPIRIYRDTELRLLPTNLSMVVNGSLQKTKKFDRRDGDLNKDFERIPMATTRSGTMSWSTGLRPLDPISYNFSQMRDLRLATASRKFLGLNIGSETSRNHKLTASHQTSVLKKTLGIIPKASWSSSFDGSFSAITTTGSGERTRSNRFGNSSTLSFSGALPVQRLLNVFGSLRPKGGPEEEAPDDSTGAQAPRGGGRSRGGRSTGGGGGGGFFSISPITANYAISKTNRLDYVSGEPSIGYQLGWARDPGGSVRRGSQTSSSSGNRNDLNLSTDLTLLSEVKIRTSYTENRNRSSHIGSVSTTKTVRFPDLSINWGRIHKKLGLDRVAKDLRASTNYTRNRTESGSVGTDSRSVDTKVGLNPLLNIDAKLHNGISAKLTSRYDSSKREQTTGSISNITTNRKRQIGLSLSRSVNLSRMVTNPITKKKSKVTSKLDLSLAVNYGEDRNETSRGGVTADRVRFDVSTTAGYNFTSSITGNAALSVSQDTDRKNRTNTVRSISVTVSASFRF